VAAQKTAASTSQPSPGTATRPEGLRPSFSSSRGWLGAKIQDVDEETAVRLALGKPRGALVTEVTTPGPAADAGLKIGDAILSVNGSAVADSRDLARQIAGFSAGAKVDVRILRGQKEQTIAVNLGKLPSAELEKTEPRTVARQFDGEWRVVYLYNENCRATEGVGHWTIADGVVMNVEGVRGTVSSIGEVRFRRTVGYPPRTYVVRAHLDGKQGRGNFQIEGRPCGGIVRLTRM
jgi:membrane-associated protease RseP (regulator of RpoE activity)